MSAAVIPRSKKKFTPPPVSASSSESKKCNKKAFYGTGETQRRSGKQQEVAVAQHHPWSGFIDNLLKPLPPDWQMNISRALGGFAEAVGRMFPQNKGDGVQVGRRGF